MRKTFALIAVVSLAGSLMAAPARKHAARASAAPFPAAATSSLKLVSPERIRAHVKFLSDDLLEGRGTGQRGGDIAVKYIAAQFALQGLKPAGDNGTYLQRVPMLGVTTQPSTSVEFVPGSGAPIGLTLLKDVVATDQTGKTESDVDADLVFVGYGIDAPEYKWDDYKGVDVKGKVLLMLVNEPPSDDPNFFNGKALTYYGRWTYKYEEAARRGAVGAIIVHKTDMASYGWNVVETSWGGEESYLRNDGKPKLNLAGWIQLPVADKVAQTAGKSIDQLMEMARSRDFKPFTLPVKVKAHIVSKVRSFDVYNVVAELPGSSPALKNQGILYTAHWDHLGIHAGEPGDNIYNGAVDNATGVGVLLEIAHAFAQNPIKPKRSIFFASVAAEEQGLDGSEWLGLHPPVPASKVSLALNFDGIAPIGIPEEVSVTGAERTTFYPTVEQTAREFKMAIVPDDNPGAGHYYRSDHFSFARVGIPAFSVNQGSKFEGKPKSWGEAYEKEYTKNNYHQPSDEFHKDWNFEGNAKMARFGVSLGWKAANWSHEVQWQSGDEFEAARKASQSAAK